MNGASNALHNDLQENLLPASIKPPQFQRDVLIGARKLQFKFHANKSLLPTQLSQQYGPVIAGVRKAVAAEWMPRHFFQVIWG